LLLTAAARYHAQMLPAPVPWLRQPLGEFVQAVREHFTGRLVEIKLFGSYARGDARADSDVDVAVIVEGPITHAERVWSMGFAGELTAKYDAVITPLVLTRAELELLQQREDILAENLAREGLAL
jgi:predicted nucleotidyltransferase